MPDRRQVLTGAAALAGLGLTRGGARAQAPASVIALSEQRSRFLLEVGVDDATGYRFVLDTGASTHFISTRLVEHLRLPKVEDRMVRGYAGLGRDTVVGLSRFNVGGVEMGRSRAVAWTPERLEDHDGLVGYPFLFPRAVLSLGAGHLSLGGAEAGAGLTAVKAQVMRNQTLLLGGVEGAVGRFVFDTGAQACTISPAYHDKIRRTGAYKSAAQLVYRNAEGVSRTTAFRPARLAFGDFAIDNPVVRVGQADGREGVFAGVEALMGVSLLRPYTWVIDQAAGTLQAAGAAAAQLGYYGSGLRLARRGDATEVAEVADDSPAAEAGVRPGQRVLGLAAVGDRQRFELVGRTVELRARALL